MSCQVPLRAATGRPPRVVRAWYGLRAEIEVENEHWHLVRVGGVTLNHPPIVNLILRRGLRREARLRLSFLHEFGHLQTLPVALAHAALLLVIRQRRRRGSRGALATLSAAVVAHASACELTSELYVAVRAGCDYRRIYRAHPNRIGQVLFWGGLAALAAITTLGFSRRTL